MKIHVHDVDAKVTGSREAHQSVQIGPVHINQSTTLVHNLSDSGYVLFEDSKRVGICEHQGGHIVAHRRLQVPGG